MGDFPNPGTLDVFLSAGAISTGQSMLGMTTGNSSNIAWASANLAVFVPVRIPYPVTVYKIAVGAGSTAAGNFDVGIYDSSGNRLVSSGATAKGASTEHIIDVTDTVIGPGLFYLALAADGTNNYMCWSTSVQVTRLVGVVQMASAYTLPSAATFAASSNSPIPVISAYLRGF